VWDYVIEAKVAIRNEFKADEFAAKTAGTETTIRALEKLSEMSPYPKRTGLWFQAITYHPSIEERIRHLKNLGGGRGGVERT
jgi:STE24 endopeptidase